ncbi:hypothetical protein Sked_01680 [Sanguibacter keddieii DSM 10542]|uniref:Outer membrane lipoprotein-sorting protein n=1 Tax=Sanguibacter keddieii (strain ATCC 51767 / DSM 10542 / NCFB 3025 / ST-74) TaxID=446469 RepID=D1BIU8_SANKS|nr:hypothetical protein Sked_01680 [Sanguibacter keddieii DSM 10542]
MVTAAVVAGAFTLPSALASTDTPDLADITASELAEKVASATPVPVSGTVVMTTRLGLPDLNLAQVQGAGPLDLLGGSSTVRVWSDGDGKARSSLLGDLSEYTVVTDGGSAWTYSSSDDEAVHYAVAPEDQAALDELKASAEELDPAVVGDLPTPQAVAEQALAYADETSEVTVLPATQVAGRDAYQLELSPDSDATLVDRVLVAVDAETSVPLRAQVWSTQDPVTPAVEIAFTDISYDTVDPTVFDFTPPPGATTRDVVVPLPETTTLPEPGSTTKPEGAPGTRVIGTGWESVVELTDVDLQALISGGAAEEDLRTGLEGTFGSESTDQLMTDLLGDSSDRADMTTLDPQALLDQLTTDVPEGQLITSSLLTVLLTDDGRVYAGAVPAETLQALAR